MCVVNRFILYIYVRRFLEKVGPNPPKGPKAPSDTNSKRIAPKPGFPAAKGLPPHLSECDSKKRPCESEGGWFDISCYSFFLDRAVGLVWRGALH